FTLAVIVLASVLTFAMAGCAAWLMERGFHVCRRIEEELGITYKVAQRQALELRSIIDCMPDAVYFGTRDGITISNENARRMLGVRSATELRLTAAQMAQKFELRWPRNNQLLNACELPFNRALAGETVIEEIMLTHGETGEVVHVRTACAPLMEDGRVIGAVAVNSDITARKRAELALIQSEERYRHLISIVPVAVYTCDRDGYITVTNPCAVELWGREIIPHVDRWCGSPRIFHPNGTPLALDTCPMAIALSEGRSVRGEEILIQRNDGSRRWVLAHPDPIFDASGQVIGAINALVDITPLRQAEAALRESSQRLRAHQEHSPIAVIELDADFAVAGWTVGAEKMFGWNASEVIGKSLECVGLRFSSNWTRREVLAAGASTGIMSEVSGETCNRTKLGGIVHCEWYNTVLVDAGGRVASIVARALDVTARRTADEALRTLNAELEARVMERTEVLSIAMEELREEIAERQRLEQEILKVSEHEQARLGQDLHDDLGQQLAGMAMLAQLLSNQLGAEAHPKAIHAAQLKNFLTDSINTTRDLAKSLYPVELEHGGLLLALADLAHRTELVSKVRCVVQADETFSFEKDAAIHLYRIVQESLSNALRHGKPSHITIDCVMSDGMPKVTVTNDGEGFKQPGGKWAGIGLHLFQYRARAIGAEVMVSSGENGGCKVTCLMKASRKNDV
ncbi:MAG: putative sensor signal transduction histidine kinase, partial [Chthoniobacteraceae bacterium]|nr:putative sensor signal transduction histidine kinase [Chthoniobacteraceae bacterium]